MRKELESFILYNAILQSEYVPLVCDIDHEVFSTPKTRAIHNALCCLQSNGATIDIKLIQSQLSRLGHPDTYMSELQNEMNGETLFCRDLYSLVNQLKDFAFRDDLLNSLNLSFKMLNTNVETKDVIDSIDNIIRQYQAPSKCFRIEDAGTMSDFFGSATKIKTGIKTLDDLLHGIYSSNLITIAGRPGRGKTTLALNLIEHTIEIENRSVLFVSREMGRREIMSRLVSKRTGVNYHKIFEQKCNAYEKEICDKVFEDLKAKWSKMLVIDDHMQDIKDILANARTMTFKGGLGLLVVDYIGLCDAKGANANERVSNITRSLKGFAQSKEIPVIALSQLNREVDKRTTAEPQLSDLRDSGSIEQDSNAVLFLWENEEGEYYCTIAKNRSGEVGKVRLNFNKALYNITDYNHTYMQVNA